MSTLFVGILGRRSGSEFWVGTGSELDRNWVEIGTLGRKSRSELGRNSGSELGRKSENWVGKLGRDWVGTRSELGRNWVRTGSEQGRNWVGILCRELGPNWVGTGSELGRNSGSELWVRTLGRNWVGTGKATTHIHRDSRVLRTFVDDSNTSGASEIPW